MENQENNSSSSLKVVIAILAILLVGSLVCIFKITSDAKALQTELTKTVSEKEGVIKDLQELKTTYDAAIAENTSMSAELIKERDKVLGLMEDVKNSKGDVTKYKTQFLKLRSDMKVLLAENEGLKKQNKSLTTQRDSTIVVLGESKKVNEVLVGKNEGLTKTVELGSKLTVLNMKTSAYKMRSSGKQIVTERAGRADVLKISFTIAENKIAKSGDKTYYVTNVKYANKTVEVSEDLPGKDFAKGAYFVNVFDKDELVSKTSFTLK